MAGLFQPVIGLAALRRVFADGENAVQHELGIGMPLAGGAGKPLFGLRNVLFAAEAQVIQFAQQGLAVGVAEAGRAMAPVEGLGKVDLAQFVAVTLGVAVFSGDVGFGVHADESRLAAGG